jgi:cytochrome c556
MTGQIATYILLTNQPFGVAEMNARSRRLLPFFALSLVAVAATGAKLAVEAPAPPKVSEFASADDLLEQFNYYNGRLKETVAAEYDEAKQSRSNRDANTLAVLAQHLGRHDSDNAIKKSAAGVIKAAQDLTKATDQKTASAAYSDLEKAMAGGSGDEVKWGKVAAMGQLMKQVNVINPALKRGLQPARIKSQAKMTAGHTATLAAIANSLLFDTHEVKNEADLPSWYEYAAEFRESAHGLNAAIKSGETAKVSSALTRMNRSCDTCHKKFHQELGTVP